MNHLQQSTNERTSLLAFSTRFSFWTLIISLIAIVATAIGAKNLYFRGDYNIFFDGSNAQLQAFDEIQTTFAKTDNIALVLAPKSGDVFDQRTLTQIQEMTEQAWQVPYSSRVDSLANYQHTEAVDDDLLVEDLLYQSYPLTAERIAKVRTIAMSEPLLVNALVSEKGDVAVINITMQMPGVDETAEVNEVVAYVEQMLSHYRAQYPDVTIYKAGIIAMNHSFAMAAQNDSATLVPTMLLVILVFLTLMLRSFLSVLATLVVIIGAIVATLGIVGWAGMFLHVASVNVPTLIMT